MIINSLEVVKMFFSVDLIILWKKLLFTGFQLYITSFFQYFSKFIILIIFKILLILV